MATASTSKTSAQSKVSGGDLESPASETPATAAPEPKTATKRAPAKSAAAKKTTPAKPAAEKKAAVEKKPAVKKAVVRKTAVRKPAKAAVADILEDDEKLEEGVDVGMNDDDSDDEGASGTATSTITEPVPTGAIVLKARDEEDVPTVTTLIPGATADPVKDYLKQIGKVALLNAAEEVELAMRIEAGLFAEEKLATEKSLPKKLERELKWVARDGQRAKSHLLGANLRLVVSLAKRYTGRGMQFLEDRKSVV